MRNERRKRAGTVSRKTGPAEKLRGANLGNWLVLEKWMQPSMFAGTDAEDETWYHRRMQKDPELRERLRRHRETYVTEEDFRQIAAAELNLVRIPVPYYVFGDREGIQGCVGYLDRAFVWAEKYGLRILIDLHTVPGGQNGYDNGGIVGVCRWHRNGADVEYVLSVLERLAERYGKREGLFGIEVVNEPISYIVWRFAESTRMAADPEEAEGSGAVPTEFLRDFYRRAYARLRKVLPEDKAVVFHDGFRSGPWIRFFRREKMKNVYLDMHPYIWAMEMFVPFHRPWVYRIYLAFQRARIRKLQRSVPVLVGEWCVCNHWTHDLPGFAGYGKEHRKRELPGNPGINAASRALERAEREAEKLKREAEHLRLEAEKKLEKTERRAEEALGIEGLLPEKKRKSPKRGERNPAATAGLPAGTAKERRRRAREIAKLELAAWREAAGWCYWSWKLEPEPNAGRGKTVYSGANFWKAGWDLRWCLNNGWMPKHAGRF